MTVPQIVLSIIYFIVALALVAIVMLQSGKSAGARLARMTKWVAIVFMVLTLVLCLLPSA